MSQDLDRDLEELDRVTREMRASIDSQRARIAGELGRLKRSLNALEGLRPGEGELSGGRGAQVLSMGREAATLIADLGARQVSYERNLEAIARGIFEYSDADGNGTIDREEIEVLFDMMRQLRSMMALFGEAAPEDAFTSFDALDLDGNGEIDFDEFWTAFSRTYVVRGALTGGDGGLTKLLERFAQEESALGEGAYRALSAMIARLIERSAIEV